MKVYRIKSFAKINLNLNIIARSKIKKLHLIESLIGFVNLSDKILIKKIGAKSHKVIFRGKFSQGIQKKNSIKKLLDLLDKNLKLKNNKYKIIVKKEIPIKSGMGGGSMNAASLLSFFYKRKLLQYEDLNYYANKIGSDVILGLNNKAKILYSNGVVKPVKNLKKFYVLIVKPPFGCSTKKIYSLNKNFSTKQFFLKNQSINNNLIINGKNDLEKIAFKKYPKLKKLKLLLSDNKNTEFVRMTGSGSAIIMYFKSKIYAKNALNVYKRKLNNCLCIFTKII